MERRLSLDVKTNPISPRIKNRICFMAVEMIMAVEPALLPISAEMIINEPKIYKTSIDSNKDLSIFEEKR